MRSLLIFSACNCISDSNSVAGTMVGNVACLGVGEDEPVVFLLAGLGIASAGGWRNPSGESVEDLECDGVIGGVEPEVDGGVGRALSVRTETLVSVEARCRRGGSMGSGSSNTTEVSSTLAGGEGGGGPCWDVGIIRVNWTALASSLTVSSSSVTWRMRISWDPCLERVESRGWTVWTEEEEAVSGAVWKEAADDETMLFDDKRWASMDIGDGERWTVLDGGIESTAALAIVVDDELVVVERSKNFSPRVWLCLVDHKKVENNVKAVLYDYHQSNSGSFAVSPRSSCSEDVYHCPHSSMPGTLVDSGLHHKA
jgi:hypothetical protein